MRGKENDAEAEAFRRKSVLAVCLAGSDRSRYIAEELVRRGYFAANVGVLGEHNFVTPEDLERVGIIVFASTTIKRFFDDNNRWKKIVKLQGIGVRVLNITEDMKDRAHNTGNLEELRQIIAEQLDCVGLMGPGREQSIQDNCF